MTCGCVYAPSSLHNWAQEELKEKSMFKQFECPNCKGTVPIIITLWSFDLVACACGWNEQEYNTYYQLFKRKQLDHKQNKSCPFCYAIVFKPEDNDQIRVHCGNKNCLVNDDWCWKCGEKWKSNESTICGNYSCAQTIPEKNLNLKSCPTKRFTYGGIDCDVPIYRACIQCNQVIEHDTDCNNMGCPRCQTHFCFICLQKWPCEEQYEKHDAAPRQILQ